MIRDRIQAALKQAMIDRDRPKVSVLRTLLSEIDNASAVAISDGGLAMEASPIGAGASDVDRRAVGEDEVLAILEHEADEREESAVVYEKAGESHRATVLRDEAALIRSLLAQSSG